MRTVKDEKTGVTLQYPETMDEVIAILTGTGQKPVYTSIGKDADGCEVAVPMFTAR